MNVAQETLGFRRQGLSPCLSLLMSAFALPISPADLSIHLPRRTERSSTTAPDPSTHTELIAHLHDCLVMESFCNSHHARNKTRARLVAKRGGDAMCLKDLERSAASVIGLSPVTSSAQH